MATKTQKNGIELDTPFYGEYGNAIKKHFSDTLVAASSGAVANTHRIGILPGGIKITDFREVHAALSTDTGAATLSWGWEYVDGSAGGAVDALLAAASNDAAGGSTADKLVPFVLEKPVYLTCTTSVEACAGKVDALVTYQPIGTA